MATSEISNDPSVDDMLDILWKNRDQMDVDIPLTHDKGRRKVFKAIRGQATKHNKQISDAQFQAIQQSIDNCLRRLTDGLITSWGGLIEHLRDKRIKGKLEIYTIIEGIYSFIEKEVMQLDGNPSYDEADHSKIIEPPHILKRNPSLKDAIQDLLAQIDSIKSSPDEKNNINLYEELFIILKLMLDILGAVETHQDGNFRTGEDLLQCINDLLKKIHKLKDVESSNLVETEMMKEENDKLKQKYDDAQQEIQQKVSMIDSLMFEIEKRSHELSCKDDKIKHLIENHERLIAKHEQNMKDLNEESRQITKDSKKEIKALIKKHQATVSNQLNQHKEDVSKLKRDTSKNEKETSIQHDKKVKEYDIKLKKKENLIDQQAETIQKFKNQKFEEKLVTKQRKLIEPTDYVIPDLPDLPEGSSSKYEPMFKKNEKPLGNIAPTTQPRKPKNQSKDNSVQLFTLKGTKVSDLEIKTVMYALSFDPKCFAESDAFKEIGPVDYTPKHKVFRSIVPDIEHADYVAYAYMCGSEAVASAYRRKGRFPTEFKYESKAHSLAMLIREEVEKHSYQDCLFCLAIEYKGKNSTFPPKEFQGQFVKTLTNDLIKELRALDSALTNVVNEHNEDIEEYDTKLTKHDNPIAQQTEMVKKFAAQERSLKEDDTSDVHDARFTKLVPQLTFSSKSADLKNEEGIYHISEQDITISNPNTMDYGLTRITITSQPVTEKEFVAPDGAHILSQMITLEPHGVLFEKHILVKFPIYQHRYRSDQDVCLMYSDGISGCDGEKHWVNISQHNTPVLHKDEISWFINQGFCYMFLRHFSHIFLLEVPQSSNTVPAQYGMFLLVTVFGKYVKNKLIATVGFHCHRCFANLLESKGNFGTLLGYKLHCVYGLQGPVTIHIAVNNNNGWECFNPEQEISVDQLLPLCNIDAIYNNTVVFRAKGEVNVDMEIEIDVKVLQDKQKSNIFLIACLKDILEQVGASTTDAGVMTDVEDEAQENVCVTACSNDISKQVGASTTDAGVKTDVEDVAQENVCVTACSNDISKQVGASTTDAGVKTDVEDVAQENVCVTACSNDISKQVGASTTDAGVKTDVEDVAQENVCVTACSNDISVQMEDVGVMTDFQEIPREKAQTSATGFYKEISETTVSRAVSVKTDVNSSETQNGMESNQSNQQSLDTSMNESQVAVKADAIFSPLSNTNPHISQQYQAKNIGAAGMNQFYPFYQNIIQYINYNQRSNALDAQLPEADCVFNRSVVSEQERLCDIINNDCEAQLAEIAKAVGDTNGTVDIKNLTALSLLQVWKIHVKEGKCTWREFYDMLVKLKCQSAALQLKVVCDKDSLVGGLSKLKRDISLDSELCGILLELDVINLAENDEITSMKSPPEKISFLVLELLVKKPGNYVRVKGFFQALHSMRYYGDYLKEFMLCPEDLDQIDATQ